MQTAPSTLDQLFLEMRWRALSLAADFDRVQRLDGDSNAFASDPRLQSLRAALARIAARPSGRSLDVQLLFSDPSPRPPGVD